MRYCNDCDFYDNKHYSLEDFKNMVPYWKDWGYCTKHKPLTLSKDGKCFGDWPAIHKFRGCAEFRFRPEEESENGLS